MNRTTFFQSMKTIATLGPIGYLPASGTMASICTIPVIILLKTLHLSFYTELLSICIVTMVSALIIHYAKQLSPFVRDPQYIVLDEVVGCLWAFGGISLTIKKVIVGFLLFRFFDIVKPLGVRLCEQIPGAFGILADDVVAGNYTALLLMLLFS